MNERQGGKSLSPRGSFSCEGRGGGRERERIGGGKKTSVFGLCASSPCLFFLSFHHHTRPLSPSPSFSRERSRESRNDDESLLKCF